MKIKEINDLVEKALKKGVNTEDKFVDFIYNLKDITVTGYDYTTIFNRLTLKLKSNEKESL